MTTNPAFLGLDRTWEAFFGARASYRPIQRDAIPRILAGRNVMLCAPTGSGKTEAAVAPLVERSLKFQGSLSVVYICPTRALINDLARRISVPVIQLGMHLGVQHGDNRSASGGRVPELLLITPESLDGALSRTDHPLHERLKSVRAVVIDEVHSLYGNPRGAQLRILLERLVIHCGRSFQRVAMSATIARPELASKWFQGSGTSFEILKGYPGRDFSLAVESITSRSGSDYKSGACIRSALSRKVPINKKMLLFANTRRECDWLFQHLEGQIGIPVHLHYSSLPRERREETERRFRDEPRSLCIATSTLELGIDIGDIDAVVMFGAPKSVASFAQRLGRGNRRSLTSTVYGMCRPYSESGGERRLVDDVLLFVALASALDHGTLETVTPPYHYGVVVQQLVTTAIRYGVVAPDALIRELDPLGFPDRIRDILGEILPGMVDLGFLSPNPLGSGYVPSDAIEELRLGGNLWGNIAGTSVTAVRDSLSTVADVPSDFALRLQPGAQIRVAGRVRRVIRNDGTSIATTRVHGPVEGDVETPGYRSEITFESAAVAECAGNVLRGQPLAGLPLCYDEATRLSLTSERNRFASVETGSTPIEHSGNALVIHTFLGGLLNRICLDLMKSQKGASGSSDGQVIRVKATVLNDLNDLDTSVQAITDAVRSRLGGYGSMLSLSPFTRCLPEHVLFEDVIEAIRPAQASEHLSAFVRKPFRQLGVALTTS
ncbi:MAG: DEAD/DEAH box helicase [Actinobacteria bacterium]|nr:DEAD/DEAH box helicase [Actinomycetota bacterium]